MAFFQWRRDRGPLALAAVSLTLVASDVWHWPYLVRRSMLAVLTTYGLYVLFTRYSRATQGLVLSCATVVMATALAVDYYPEQTRDWRGTLVLIAFSAMGMMMVGLWRGVRK